MLKNDRSALDYAQLLKRAKRLGPVSGPKLKVALLADVSTQHLIPLLRVLFADNGVDVELYEAGFDTIELESRDPNSALYAFAPQVLVLLQSTTKLKRGFYASNSLQNFALTQADSIETVWNAFRAHTSAVIVQNTFVLPYERPSGNFGRLVDRDLVGAVTELNREISLRARRHASVLINDLDYLAGWVGRRKFFDEKLWGLAKSLCAFEFLPDVAQNIVDICLATIGRAAKCVVLDLDNTLWGGVIGDDGLDGIILGDSDEDGAFRGFQLFLRDLTTRGKDGAFRGFQLFLRDLTTRGIILAVCSKNTDSIALEVFQKHPGMVLKEEHIAVFVANWDDKATNIRHIRETLNIGFDSMVFLDDNPFERNLVRQLIPEIIVPELPEDPALYVRAISELNLFETATQSTADAGRTAQYQEQQKRATESKQFATLDEYLQSLQTTAAIRRFEPYTLARISQLIQRSNQFNLTTRRYTEAECQHLMDDQNVIPFTLSVQDRFGDFGLINVVILRARPAESVLEIDTFLMSCRVLQRGVEQLAMNQIFEHARAGGYQTVAGRFIPTAKNMMVKSFFEQFGFRCTATAADGTTHWQLTPSEYAPRKVFIDATAEAGTISPT